LVQPTDVTALLITWNEAPNIARCLASLPAVSRIIVIDSGSQDETLALCARVQGVRAVHREFDSFAEQCNFGLTLVETEWVLSLDADYILTNELCTEMAALPADAGESAYYTRFRYSVFGRPLRGTLYPPRAVLFRKSHCRYVQDGHAHKLVIDGASRFLHGQILHDDRKPLTRWLQSQQSYARLEANKLTEGTVPGESLPDRLRRWLWPAAPAAFFYTLIVKRCLFDGWPGWYYALQRTYAELLLSLELLDRRLRGNDNQ
jgi:glycosyltransferase involved in cell wall biosynthesis